ncbi:enoyl-CoA hydratase [Bhargavaea ginsengi]|uniref:Enoyl-CoA hydratase n=1 Tax=Bhargavaea ginsengi TaxID=426757 RepID=A0A1H6U510_9BACL|nr:enoyl-CoA hydratase-related protein [Bhargavaea ginsengi]SEI87391.1 enoyl-CoA hydratase [Bhargavaea ginsengi]
MQNVLLFEVHQNIAVLEINRPPYNPLNPEVIKAMSGYLDEIYRNDEIRALVIKGSGEKAFSAGADIQQFVPKLGSRDLSMTAAFHQTFEKLSQLPIPVISALKGHVLGGGLELALSCDFRICDENTKLGLPEVNLGIFPGAGGTQRLPRLVGSSKAMEIMMFGDSIGADEALQAGLVNRVVSAGESDGEAVRWAEALAVKPKAAIAKIKKAVVHGQNLPLAEGIRYEIELFSDVFKNDDAKEGVQAFIEKRKPSFAGR